MTCKRCEEERAKRMRQAKAAMASAAKLAAPLIAQVKRDREQWNRKK